MKTIGILLLVLAGIGGLMATMMYGDIGVAAMIGSVASLLAGLGFLKANKEIAALKK